jgi:carbon-monoxide dehydrogenase large subunit
MMQKEPMIGRSVPRLEDPPLVTGQGQFVADLNFPHQVVMRVVRSPYAHAAIRAIRVAAAQAAPGVIAVWTHADISELPPVDFRDAAAQALLPYRQPLLAHGVVRYVGEPIAVVFATDAYLAEDAAALVELDAETLPPVLEAAAPPGEFTPGVSTEATVLRTSYGDVAGAFASAHLVVALELDIGRHSGVPLETRGAIARYEPAQDRLELHGAAKIPHRNRDAIARFFDRPAASVVLRELHVGGGFGVRGELYPEDFLVCAAAMRLGRPIKWIEDRHEHLMATNHSRQQHHRARMAVDADGNVLAMDDTFYLDQGAYVRTHAARVVDMTISMLPGPYRVPAFSAAGHFRLTNKTPAATYRAPGHYESSFVRERLMDVVADRLGIDGVELRRRNLIGAEEMPFHRPIVSHGIPTVHDSGDYRALLEHALVRFGWTRVQSEMRARRGAGELVGAGFVMFLEKGGVGPRDGAHITVDAAGAVELVTGGASVGQGFDTAMAQICADTLGVDYRRVRVVHGQTDRIEFGIGAHASRATVMTGGATHQAALAVRAKALAVAAQHLQADAAALDIVDGCVVHTDGSGAAIALGEIARLLAVDAHGLDGSAPGLAAEGWFDNDQITFPYGAMAAVVRVDAATGRPTLERCLVAYDIGRAVNPMLVEGQLVGGVVQGIGGALFEEFLYDPNGEPISVTLADYLLPTMSEVPDIDVLLRQDCPSPGNPLGVKAAGEAGINAVGAVIAAAIGEAIGRPDAITRLPVTPQRLKHILDTPR